MTDCIVLERVLDPPIALDDLTAMEAQATWCMQQYRVQHQSSLLSADGRQMMCAFAAPDTEAVRSVLRQLDVAPRGLWPATVLGPETLPVLAPLATTGTEVTVVARHFEDPIEIEALDDRVRQGAWCFEQHRVRWLRSWLAHDRQTMLCAYTAPDAESVRVVQRQVELPFSSVRSAGVFVPSP
jgi:hypothetical protein